MSGNVEIETVEIFCNGEPVNVPKEKLDKFLARPAYSMKPKLVEETGGQGIGDDNPDDGQGIGDDNPDD